MAEHEIPEVEVGEVIVTRIRKESEGFGSRKESYPFRILEVWTKSGVKIAVGCEYAAFERNYWMAETDRLSLALERAKSEIARLKNPKKKAAKKTT